MKKLIILLSILIFSSTPAAALTPNNEVWQYSLVNVPQAAFMYAFKDSKVYVYACSSETECAFYKIPCGASERAGTSCAVYTPFYASMFQMGSEGDVWQVGWMQSWFLIKFAMQLHLVRYEGLLLPFVMFMKLQKIGSVDLYEGQFNDEIPILYIQNGLLPGG